MENVHPKTQTLGEFQLSRERILLVTSANQNEKECEKEPKLQKVAKMKGADASPRKLQNVSSYPTTNLNDTIFFHFFFTFSFSLSRMCNNLRSSHLQVQQFLFSFPSSDGFSRVMMYQKLLYLHHSVYHNSEKPWLWLIVVKALLKQVTLDRNGKPSRSTRTLCMVSCSNANVNLYSLVC